MTRPPFKLALVQMRVDGGNQTANLQRAAARLEAAAQHGARVAVLPEAADLGWTHPSAATEAGEIPGGKFYAMLSQAARQWHLYVCSGLTERDGSVVFNSAVLLGPSGELLLKHRKLNELTIGHACYAQGDRLAVAHTPLGTFGLMICADAFARGQIVSRTLGLMGADIILSPSAWAVPADHDQAKEPYGQLWLDNYRPVAREFRLWIAGVSNVGPLTAGPWQGRRCIGCSLLIDPQGQTALQGPYGSDADTLLDANIELAARPARGDGWWQR